MVGAPANKLYQRSHASSAMRLRGLGGGRRHARLRREISARLLKYAQLRPLDRRQGS